MKKMNVLPFYMTYPTVAYTKENVMVEDLEYFQQMYLNGARMLQREIVKSISILDYDGSMIYDAYPDQFMLRRLSAKLLEKMKKQTKPEDPLYKVLVQEGIDELVFLILLNEVLKRRHKKDMGFLQF